MNYKVGPSDLCKWGEITRTNGGKQMGNWGEIYLPIGVATSFITGDGAHFVSWLVNLPSPKHWFPLIRPY